MSNGDRELGVFGVFGVITEPAVDDLGELSFQVGMTTRSGPTVMIGLAPPPGVISSSGHLLSRTW